jgi:hypothetical protein
MDVSTFVMIVSLTVLNLGLIWLLLAIPLGRRTVTRTIAINATPMKLWNALYPFMLSVSKGRASSASLCSPTMTAMVTR